MSTSFTPRYYALAWRWHFYAGLFVIPVLLMLAITGSIYLFKPQLDSLMYPQLLTVTPAAQTVNADMQQAKVAAQYPGMTLKKYIPPLDAQSSSQFQIKLASGESRSVFVDPYRNVILGEQDPDWTLQGIAVRLHGELLAGKWGDLIVELAASWGVLLVVSGLYLWWPRKQGIWGVFAPRLRAGKRVFWRDLHVVGGFWTAGVLLFLLLTGLPWTGFWGEKFANVWAQYPSQLWDAVPESSVPARSLNSTLDKTVPWAIEPAPLPESSAHAQHGAHGEHAPSKAVFSLSQAQARAQEFGLAAGYKIALPHGDKGVYTLSSSPDDPALQRTYHIDQYSGKVLAQIQFADYGFVPKAVEYGIAIHEGKYFGLANQLLMLLVCCMLVLTCISGLVMWWKRKPANAFGAPKTPLSLWRWKHGLAIALSLALLLPTVLASIALVFIADFVILRRLNRIA